MNQLVFYAPVLVFYAPVPVCDMPDDGQPTGCDLSAVASLP